MTADLDAPDSSSSACAIEVELAREKGTYRASVHADRIPAGVRDLEDRSDTCAGLAHGNLNVRAMSDSLSLYFTPWSFR